MKKIRFTFYLILLLTISSKAQISFDRYSLGVGFGGYDYGLVGSTSNIYIRGKGSFSDNQSLVVALNYNIPFDYNRIEKAQPLNTSNGDKSIEVALQSSFNIYNVSLDYYYNLLNENDDNCIFFVLVNFGINYASASNKISNYDKEKYALDYSAKIFAENDVMLNLGGGLGLNYNIEPLTFFAELKFAILGGVAGTDPNEKDAMSNYFTCANLGVYYNFDE